jgi:hypothetical protein
MIEADIFGKSGNGTLDAAISRQIDPRIWDLGDMNLNVCIDDEDFVNIHSETYRLTFGEKPDLELFNTTKLESILGKISLKFPMLCRFNDMYKDAIFEADEVKLLREECEKLKNESQDNSTDLALRKLFYCCEEAVKANLSLGFWCD